MKVRSTIDQPLPVATVPETAIAESFPLSCVYANADQLLSTRSSSMSHSTLSLHILDFYVHKIVLSNILPDLSMTCSGYDLA